MTELRFKQVLYATGVDGWGEAGVFYGLTEDGVVYQNVYRQTDVKWGWRRMSMEREEK